ncbi:MAG: hypothetical protein QM780_14280 [Hyphomicrobium sp.]|uniref:hypothetical protein n=1 Tax=Hyphomicrobium sp. TaxID=82 RepID=UPI0039E39C4B
MGAGEVIGILVSIISVAAGLPEVYRQYQKDPRGFWKTIRLMGAYCLYGSVGIALLLLSLDGPQPPDKAGAATAFMILWIIYGALWLVRLAPRQTPLPGWVARRFSLLDYAIAGVIFLSGSYVFLG